MPELCAIVFKIHDRERYFLNLAVLLSDQRRNADEK
jgi:hypothetical protein